MRDLAVRALGLLLFSSDAFERVVVGFLIDESSVVSVPLCPSIIRWVVGLRSVLHGAVPVSVAGGWVLCHE